MGTRDNPRYPRTVARYIDSLRARFVLDTVVLFGSRARGDNDEHSDWDLFVVGHGFPENWRERIQAVERDKPVGVDVFAWNKSEVRQFIYRTFIQDIALEGMALYGDMKWLRELAREQIAGHESARSELADESLP
jgi:hypothetical protein